MNTSKTFIRFLATLSLALMISTGSALAAPSVSAFVSPDLYQLEGGAIHITYSTTGIDGRSHLSYSDGNRTLAFSGEQIQLQETAMGSIVTVVVQSTVDSGSTTFSLVLPRVNIDARGISEQIHALGVTTVHRFSVIPAFNHGQRDLYTETMLSGSAQLVVF